MKAAKPAQRLSSLALGLSLLWLAALLAQSLYHDRSLLFSTSGFSILEILGQSLASLPRYLFQINPAALWIFPLGLSGFGLGRAALLRLFKIDAPAGISLGLGLGLLSLLAFGLAAFGLANPVSVRGLLAVLAASGLLELARVWPKSASRLRSLSAAEWLIAAVVAGAGLIVTFSLFQPAFFYDALTFHLALPRSYLLTGDTLPRPFITYSYFPQNLEMLYLLGLAAGGVTAAQLVNALVWLALILVGRDLGLALFGREAGAFSALALALLPCLSQGAMLLTNDGAVALFGLCGLWFLVRIQEQPGWRSWLGWGAALGLAAGTKTTAYLFVILPQALAFLGSRSRSGRGLLLAAAAGLALVSPWWLRNLFAVGNPLFPFFSSWLGGPIQPEQVQLLYGSTFVHLFSSSLFSFLWRLPGQIFLLDPAALDQTLGSASLVGPMLLAGLPFLFLCGRARPPEARPVLLYLLFALLAWLVMVHVMRLRYFLPGLAAATVLSGAGLEWLRRRAASRPRAALTLNLLFFGFALSLLVLLLNTGLHLTQGFFCLRQRGSAAEYLMRRSHDRWLELGSFPILYELNQKLPPDARVLLVGETAFLYLQRPCLAPSFLDPNPLVHLIQQGLPFPAIARRLREAGLTHVLFRPEELDRLERDYRANRISPEQRVRLEQFFQSEACRPFAFQEKPRVLVCELAQD